MPHDAATATLPLLYSYRDCPYCMRARLALASNNIPVRLREVKLPAKPQELLTTSPKGTVPVLVLADGTVIDQSLAVMDWAIAQPDAQGNVDTMGLGHHHTPQAEIDALIEENDTRFAKALIRLKHPERFAEEQDSTDWGAVAEAFLRKLEQHLTRSSYLAGGHATKVDLAIVPFVSQFHGLKPQVFATGRLPHLEQWINSFHESELHHRTMRDFPAWQTGQPEPQFP